jgi:hypothetical protein
MSKNTDVCSALFRLRLRTAEQKWAKTPQKAILR